MNTRLAPSDPFPEDLTSLDLPEVEVLNSRIQRELSHEYVHEGETDPETEFRNEELTDELDRRDAQDDAVPLAHALQALDSDHGATFFPGGFGRR